MTGKLLNIRYEIGSAISESAIFKTWHATDKMTGREVTIRVLNAPFNREPAFHEALEQAIKSTETIKHPGIERISALEKDEKTVFLVGDAVKGMALDERIRKLAPYSAPVAISTAVTIAEALASLHRANVTHGDVGAHNVTVLPEGTAIVQQAGLWKSYAASSTAGSVVLPQMAPYMAPEISQGSIPTPASDVYGLGIILFQLLTGRHPFHEDSPIATAMKHVSDQNPSIREINPNVPVAIEEVVKKALAKDRSERYPSAVEILSDLRMIQDALRFGRSLTWPIRPPERPTEAEMSQTNAKEEKKKQKEEDYSDVPNWLKGVVIFFVSLVLFMIGAWVVFNLQKPKLAVVPDVKRKTVAEAEAVFKEANLKLRISKKVASEQYAADTVIDTDPGSGTKVYEGDTVNVEVSAGSRFVEVPDLRGMSQDEAKLLLDSIGLGLDSRIEEKRDSDVEKGMVLSQIPEPRKRVERRTQIRIIVSSGKESPRRTTGSKQKYLYSIRIELSDIEKNVIMRVDMTDTRGTRTISEQERLPGEVVELSAEGVGEEAIFLIYYDGELITQVTKKANPDEGNPE